MCYIATFVPCQKIQSFVCPHYFPQATITSNGQPFPLMILLGLVSKIHGIPQFDLILHHLYLGTLYTLDPWTITSSILYIMYAQTWVVSPFGSYIVPPFCLLNGATKTGLRKDVLVSILSASLLAPVNFKQPSVVAYCHIDPFS